MMTLSELKALCPIRLNPIFHQYLFNIPSLELKLAMEHHLSNGGKYLRPLLVMATGLTFNATLENLDVPAAAIEIIHTYSLIHDDLPCMDNADLRRGKPTCHKVFGEAIAVLAGDALQTLAMQIIANHPAALKPDRRIRMLALLAKASGPFGMVAGQAIDISMMDDTDIPVDLLENMYRLKTGALFSACVELGYLASRNDDEIHLEAMRKFGDNIGLAFQIQDDILDVEATTESLGKTQGIDNINNKLTYARLYGLEKSKERVQTLYLAALEAINYLGSQASLLRDLTNQMLKRQN